MPKLTILVPDEEPLKIAFDDQDTVTVGRADDNDIVLTHDSISGNHAMLQRIDDHYILVDLESTNGTFFNGAAANNDRLHNGSEIIFGQVPASYETEDVAEDAAADEPVAEEPAASEFSDTTTTSDESYSHSIHAEAASQSLRPAGFNNLSPLNKPDKKNTTGQVVMLVAGLALCAALATVATAMMMSSGS
jgi:hypothetical protein